MSQKHPSHVTRFSFDASTYDEVCVRCGATDKVPGGWGDLANPCSNSPPQAQVDGKPVESSVQATGAGMATCSE